MYIALNNIPAFEKVFTNADGQKNKNLVSLPSFEDGETVNMTLTSFFDLDYKISNPLILHSNKEIKAVGEPFSISKNGTYVFGLFLYNKVNVENLNENLIGSDGLKSAMDEMIRQNLVKFLRSVEVPENRGKVSVIVGNKICLTDDNVLDDSDVFQDHYDYDSAIPFLISTSVFYNAYRVKTGVFNDLKVLETYSNKVQSELAGIVNSLGSLGAEVKIYEPELTKCLNPCYGANAGFEAQNATNDNENSKKSWI